MKKLMSWIVFFSLIVVILSKVQVAEASVKEQEDFSFYNEDGELVTVVVEKTGKVVNAKVYLDGRLIQSSEADHGKKQVSTGIYGGETWEAFRKEEGVVGDFTETRIYLPESEEKIELSDLKVENLRNDESTYRSIYNEEPVDNTGLSPSEFQDYHYYLGMYGGLDIAPQVYGRLYRSFSSQYIGERKYYRWTQGTTLSAITAVLSGVFKMSLVTLVVSLLLFTGKTVLAFAQGIELSAYANSYGYRVRINGDIYFTANRYLTYWKVRNTETNADKWYKRSFDGGYMFGNTQMVEEGIKNYVRKNKI